MSKFKRYRANTRGRDFICGDIHGCFSDLEVELKNIGFKKSRDMLYCLGDLIDRGPESHRCLEYLNKSWFRSIMGNHELLMLSSLNELILPWTSRYWMPIWVSNGAYWWDSVPEEDRAAYPATLRNLPLCIELEVGNKVVGLVHAEVFRRDWQEVVDYAKSCPTNQWDFDASPIAQMMVWDRDKYYQHRLYEQTGDVYKGDIIHDIDHVFHGHTIVERPLTIGNCTYIDTGSFNVLGKITIIEAKDYL